MSFEERQKLPQWGALICKNTPDDVKLYYDFSSSATDIFLAVTDLRFVWEASLTREEVVNDAHEQNCSIDPSESTTQFHTLLTKLKTSLAGGDNDLGSERGLAHGSQSLSLRTSLKLLAPLKLLTWTFHLQQQDSARLAEAVTFSLLGEAALMRQQMHTLFQVIKDKDHVLSKLLDKIDNSAIDLSLIFPGITGMKSRKQRVGVAEASKHVPGMAVFDRTSWESGPAEGHDRDSHGSTSFNNVLRSIDINKIRDLKSKDWTQELPRLDEPSRTSTTSDSEKADSAPSVGPPQYKKPPKARTDDSGSATESDFEDLADTSHRQRIRREKANDSGSSPPARIALATKSLLSSPAPANGARSAPQKFDIPNSSCGSDSDDAARQDIIESKKSTSKFGMLGGKREAGQAPLSPSPHPASSKASTLSRKLGVLGGRRAPTNSQPQSPVLFRSRSNTPDAPLHKSDSDTASSASSRAVSRKGPRSPSAKVSASPPAREESAEVEESIEDKAKRKREELKRSQARASAGPSKKKARRF